MLGFSPIAAAPISDVGEKNTLLAEVGSYTYTGITNTGVYRGYYVTTTDAYTYTGITNTATYKGYYTNDVAGAYNVTGSTISAIRLANIPATGSAYTYTGATNTTLQFGFSIKADPASFTFTGVDDTQRRQGLIPSYPSSYSLGGTDARVTRDRIFIANPSSYVLSDTYEASLISVGKLNAEPHNYTTTGVSFTYLVKDYPLYGDPEVYDTVGYGTPSYLYSVFRMIILTPNAFNVFGKPLNAVATRNLSLSSDAFTVTGVDAKVEYIKDANAKVGSFVVSGKEIASNLTNKLESSSFDLVGADITTLRELIFSADSAPYHQSVGGDTIVARTRSIICNPTTFGITTSKLRVDVKGIATADIYEIDGKNASIISGKSIVAESSNISLSATSMSLIKNGILSANTKVHTILGSDPSLIASRPFTAGISSYVMTGSAEFDVSRNLVAQSRSLSINQSNIGIDFSFIMGIGTANVVGSPVTFVKGKGITAYPSSFEISTANVSIIKEGKLFSESGEYNHGGLPTYPTVEKGIIAGAGSYNFIPNNSDSLRSYVPYTEASYYYILGGNTSGNIGKTLFADSGEYSLTYSNTTESIQVYNYILRTESADFTLAGNQSNLAYGRIFNTTYYNWYASNAANTNMKVGRHLNLAPHTFTLSGGENNIAHWHHFDVNSGQINVTGYDVSTLREKYSSLSYGQYVLSHRGPAILEKDHTQSGSYQVYGADATLIPYLQIYTADPAYVANYIPRQTDIIYKYLTLHK